MLLHLYDRWKRALEWDLNWLIIDRLRGFARAIKEQGGNGLYWGYIARGRWILDICQCVFAHAWQFTVSRHFITEFRRV